METLTVTTPTPTAATILNGSQSFTATTAATTVLTVPAGRTWQGTVTVSCSVAVAAAATTAGQARAVISTAGTGVAPAGTILAVEAKAGANASGGLTGTQGSNTGRADVVVIAPAGNAVTVQAAATITGTAADVEVSATGNLA